MPALSPRSSSSLPGCIERKKCDSFSGRFFRLLPVYPRPLDFSFPPYEDLSLFKDSPLRPRVRCAPTSPPCPFSQAFLLPHSCFLNYSLIVSPPNPPCLLTEFFPPPSFQPLSCHKLATVTLRTVEIYVFPSTMIVTQKSSCLAAAFAFVYFLLVVVL